MAENSGRNSSDLNNIKASILNQFRKGDETIRTYPMEKHPNITLVLGNTGSGKSTFVMYIAGDNSNLMSVAVKRDNGRPTGKYRIEDIGQNKTKIGCFVTRSHTEVPELTFEPETNTPLYDCPGFEENRSAEYDIAGTYFIKKILGHAKAIKFVFIVNYSSVNLNPDKNDFSTLIKHVTGMIKNVKKFQHGICLVATKVDDIRSDEDIILDMADYLKTVRNESLIELRNMTKAPELEQQLEKIQFLDALLKKNGNTYTKLDFIRQPKEPGPISEMPLMQERKRSLLNLIQKNITFIPYNETDFRYTISAQSRNYVSDLMIEINAQILQTMDAVINITQKYYDNLIKQIKNTIQTFPNGRSAVNINPLEPQTFVKELDEGIKIMKKLANETETITNTDQLFEKIGENVASFRLKNDNTMFNYSESILSSGDLFVVLQPFYKSTILVPSKKWSVDYNRVATNLGTSISDLMIEINAQMSQIVDEVINTTEQYYGNLITQMKNTIETFNNGTRSAVEIRVNPLEPQTIVKQLDEGIEILKRLANETETVTNTDRLYKKIGENIASFRLKNNNAMFNHNASISNLGDLFVILQPFYNSTTHSKKWSVDFNRAAINLGTSINNLQIQSGYIQEQTRNKIKENAEKSTAIIKSYFTIKEATVNNLTKLSDEITDEYQMLLQVRENIKASENSTECVEKMINNLIKKNTISANEMLSNIKENLNYFEYLSNVKQMNFEFTNLFNCTAQLDDVIKYLNDSKVWYSFVQKLYLQLSEYKVQKDVTKYQSVLKDAVSFEEFKPADLNNILKDCCEELYTKKDNIANIVVDKFKLKALKEVIEITISTDVILKKQCVSNSINSKLEIKGKFVKLSDIVNQTCSSPITSIEIFALNKVFFDATLDKTGENVTLSILAPAWDIQDNSMIILDGKSGEKQSKASNGATRDSKGNGGDGIDGKPGILGGSGGNFFGFGESCINVQNLTISAKGGKGGPGQDGGDGFDGESFEDPKIENEESFQSVFFGCDKSAFVDEILKNKNKGFIINTLTLSDYEEYRVYRSGGNGGKGGNGGCAGRNGISGKINVKFIQAGNPHIYCEEGNGGLPGLGGSGGHFGNSSSLLIAIAMILTREPPSCSYYYYYNKYSKPHNGDDGISCINEKELPGPNAIPCNQLDVVNKLEVVNSYKNYLRENLIDNIQEPNLRNFLHQLEQSTFIEDLYNTLGYVQELYNMEDQFHKLHQKTSVVPLYKSFLQRINKYAEKSLSEQDKKILSYLYTAALSRICNMEKGSSDFIINITKYLQNISQDINNLKTFDLSVQKNELQNIYHAKIDTKIDEAQRFVDQDILPELGRIDNQIKNQTQLLINEVLSLQNNTLKEKKELEEQQKKLQNQLALRYILGALQVTGQFLAFAGPMGVAAGAAIGGVSMVAESMTIDNTGSLDTDKMKALPTSVEKAIPIVTEYYSNRNQDLQLLIEAAKQDFDQLEKKEPSNASIKELKTKISVLQTSIKNAKNDLSSVHLIAEHKENLQKNINEYLGKLDEKKLKGDKREYQSKKVCMYLQQAVSVAEVGIDVYSKIQNHHAKLDQTSNLIMKSDEKLAQLKIYRENIDKIMIPACKTVQETVTQFGETASGKSHVALDVSKWQVQSVIKDLQLQIQSMTKGFQMQEGMKRCIEKLEYGMLTMTQAYDRIQQYKEHKEFADYVKNIASQQVKRIMVNDVELSKAIDKLNLITQSNLVLKEYKMGIDAFLQSVFPFASLYLEHFQLPEYYRTENSIANLVQKVVEIINSIKTKLENKEAVIDLQQDTNIIVDATFEHDAQPPFFIWNYDTNRETILKLLQGQEIMLEADITSATITENAIKFNEIGIRFKLVNESIQSEFEQQLQHFSVQMIHMGNSFYRCGQKIYIVYHQNVTMIHSVNKEGEQNKANKKIRNHDALLSPYTLWKIQLINTNTKKNPNYFKAIEKYLNETINLHLVGRGEYLKRNPESDIICNDLDKYYKLYKVISETDDTNKQVNHVRKRRLVTRDDSQNDYDLDPAAPKPSKFLAKNSAGGIKSPINYAINFLKSSLNFASFGNIAPFTLINAQNIGNDNTKHDTTAISINGIFDFNQYLLLADLAIKYFTKVKPYNANEKSISSSTLKAYVLDIVTKFETLLNEISTQTGINMDFDPIILMGKLEDKILSGNYTDIENVLYQSIIVNDENMFSNFDENSFRTKIQNEIVAILRQQNES